MKNMFVILVRKKRQTTNLYIDTSFSNSKCTSSQVQHNCIIEYCLFSLIVKHSVVKSAEKTRNTNQLSFPIQAPIKVFGIEGRYAHALYSAAAKNKQLEKVEGELEKLQVTHCELGYFRLNHVRVMRRACM